MFKLFRVPLIITVVAIILTAIFAGLSAAITVAILGILEISFSFDNAIVNAKILGRMNAKWQKLFMTVGVIIAVFGMRLLFPLLIVSISAHISPIHALTMAIHQPTQYAKHIGESHATIAAFGGMFLFMLFMDWLVEEREIFWLRGVERFLNKLGKLPTLPGTIALIILTATTFILGGHASTSVAAAGMLGLAAYWAVSSIDVFFNEDTVTTVAKAGLATFLYLEVLDASFSFDGVVGAFAVSNNIFLIAIGLGIGAMFIRSLTVFLTNKGTLADYRYLEHGAHWAIGVLAILLLITIKYDISDVITGLIGVAFIGSSLVHSIIANRREAKNVRIQPQEHKLTATS